MKEVYQKIKHIISKHDQIFVFIIMAMGVSIYALNVKFAITDELWNFSNIYKMYNGLIIYKDTNVIITPIFFVIGNCLFKLFGANYLVFRIYNILIYTILLWFIYILFKKMNMSKKASILGIFYTFIYIYALIPAGANYNILSMVFIVLGLIIQIDRKENFIKYFIQGIVIFMVFFTKQNIGIENIEYLLNTILQLMFFIIITIIFKTFIKNEKKEKDNSDLLLIMGLCCYLVEYPIINGYHYTLTKVISGIYLVYVIQKFLMEWKFFKDKNNKIIDGLIISGTIIIMLAFIIYVNHYKKQINNMENNIFYGVIMNEEYKKDIDLMCNYIQKQHQEDIDVKVVSYKAMAYMSLLRLNNKDFDLPFLGNLGYKGEEGLIEQIDNLSNTKILITKDEEDKIFQESSKIREYIMENLEQDGEIGDFLIYKSKIFNK